MRTLIELWQRRQDRKALRARLDAIQAERECIEAEAARRALEMRLFRLMRSAA